MGAARTPAASCLVPGGQAGESSPSCYSPNVPPPACLLPAFHVCSHNYSDSISVVGGTAFVLTGVIGEAWSRDGFRQSRVLEGEREL